MAKIKLGQRPKSFKPFPVRFALPEGDEGVITVTYKYRTKTEFGEMLDRLSAAEKPSQTASEFSWERFYADNNGACADHLLDSVDAWDIDTPLTREALVQLGDECPAAVVAMMAAYAAACREGRLGN